MGNARLGEVFILNRAGKILLKLQGRVGSRNLKVTILDHKIAGASDMKTAEERVNVSSQSIRCVWDALHAKVYAVSMHFL